MKYPELLSSSESLTARSQVITRMQENDPIYWCEHPDINAWLITRYDDVLTFFKDERLEFGSTRGEILKQPEKEQIALSSLLYQASKLLPAMPDKQHKALQSLYLMLLSPKNLKNFKKEIENIVNDTLKNLDTSNEIELARNFSYPIPAKIIAIIMGVPDKDREQFIKWSADIEPLFWPYNYKKYKAANDSFKAMSEYCKIQMDIELKKGKENLFSLLAKGVNNGELTEDQATVNAAVTLFAGHETTATTITSALRHLLENPQLFNRVKAQPELIPAYTKEVLRYYPTAGWMRRTCLENFEYKGHVIKKDQVIYIGTFAANRDSTYFPNPNEFIIERKSKKPALTFGAGRDYCLGAALAKLEIEFALKGIITRFPNMSVVASKIEESPTTLLMNTTTNLPCYLNVK